MPLLSQWARSGKAHFFLPYVPKYCRVLEVGAGSRWFAEYLQTIEGVFYESLDCSAPATYRGDINNWIEMGLSPNLFDVIVAFEVIEHVECFSALTSLLKPGGLLFLTSPVPEMDSLLHFLEKCGLLQPRTTPHVNLLRFTSIGCFDPIVIKVKAGVAQWGVFKKTIELGSNWGLDENSIDATSNDRFISVAD
jgi:hypothetical protein